MNPADQPTSTGAAGAGNTSSTSGGHGGDMLDKGVNYLEKRTGHEQKPSTTEKVTILGDLS